MTWRLCEEQGRTVDIQVFQFSCLYGAIWLYKAGEISRLTTESDCVDDKDVL